jgi:NADH-quinone oxidoreductase subunit I
VTVELLKKIFLLDILKGMFLTLRRLFTPAVTRQYPEEKRAPFPGFRGKHALVRDEQTGRAKCVGCLKCALVCPSRCITLDYREQEGGARIVTKFIIEAARCVYCGYCVEVCPVCALVLTEVSEYSAYSRAELSFDEARLLANWDAFAASRDAGTYFNKFWRPEGLDIRKMAVEKRLQQPVRVGARRS